MPSTMLGNPEALREFWRGPLADLIVKVTGKDGPEYQCELNKFLRKEPCWAGASQKAAPVAEERICFALLADLGTITVPDDYEHGVQLKCFRKKCRRKFAFYNEDITDKNFPNPTRILKPGQVLSVCAFKQTVRGTTTSEEQMTFLHNQNAVFTGAQGLSFVFEQKREQLPKGYWYASFDEKDRLWKDADGCHRVPVVDAYSVGDFYWSLGNFEFVWDDDNAFLCFRDLSAGESSDT